MSHITGAHSQPSHPLLTLENKLKCYLVHKDLKLAPPAGQFLPQGRIIFHSNDFAYLHWTPEVGKQILITLGPQP